MTVQTEILREDYIGNGATAEYEFRWQVDLATDIRVIERDTEGVETVLVLNDDYTVDGVGNSTGSITLSANLPTGHALTILPDFALTQPRDFRNQGEFFAETHEDAFDRAARIDQQQQEQIDRSMKLPETLAASGFNTTLPSLIAENPECVVMINESGNGFAVGPTANQVASAQMYAQEAEAARDAAEQLLDEFDDRWLGAKAIDPETDNDGNPLEEGAQYFNTTIKRVKYYTGIEWRIAYADAKDVDYTASGLGAVPRKVESKLREAPVSPQDFGAVADGVADDSAALVAAAATGQTVKFPAGTYLIGSNQTLDTDFIFAPGAVIKPAAGVTVTINGEIYAGDKQQIFDISETSAEVTGAFANAYVVPEWWGGTSDDTGDNAAALQAALDVDGPAVFLAEGSVYRFSTTLQVPDNKQVFGRGTLHYTGTSFAVRVAGDDIELRDFKVMGDANGTFSGSHHGIFGQRATFSPTNVVWIERLRVHNVEVSGFGETGIRLDWTRDCAVTDSYVHDCGYGGIIMLSPQRPIVSRNKILNITPGQGTSAGYGISMSRSYGSPALGLADAPTPADGVISNNVIQDIAVYTAIDLHSADNIVINGNTVRGTTVGVNLEHATGGGDEVAISNVVISGNTFIAGDGLPAPAISVDAQSGAGEISYGISITGNTIRGYGFDGDSVFYPTNGAAIYVRNASGVVVSGNTFQDCVGRCVAAYQATTGLSVVGNTVINLQESTGSVCEAFSVRHGTGQMTVNGNTMIGSTGALLHSEAINAGHGIKAGGENIVYGGAVMTTGATLSRIRSGGFINAPRVMVMWNASGAVIHSAFENIAYANSDITITKNGTGDFTVSWPTGIFNNGNIMPLYSGADPASGEVRTTQVTNTSITSARCKAFNTTGAAVDCAENYLLVWGR